MLRWICGWKPISTIPTEDCVAVYCHTSYWEAFIVFLYSQDAHIITVVKPQLFTWWSSPFLDALGFIPGPKLEDRGSGGVQTIVRQIKAKKKTRPILFLISPKGTIQNRPWRSGYKYIAAELGWPIVAMVVDYSRRTVVFRRTSELQDALSEGCPRVPSRSEVPIHVTYDPFELIGVVDLVALSNLTMIPAIVLLFIRSDYLTGTLATTVFCVSWLYHSSCEKEYARADSYMAKALIVIALVRYYQSITIHLALTCALAFWLYYAGTPRNSGEFRGPYVVYHGLYHCVLSYAAYQLVSQ